MTVLVLTIFVSLLLTVLFILGFLYQSHDKWSSPERDSLFPLEEEKTTPASSRKPNLPNQS